jgi:mannitol/fructose-specific phosphotransferase system IIA component (Ntr-type)
MSITNMLSSQVGLARIFPTEAIVVGLEDTSKPAVIAALVQRLVVLGRVPRREERGLVKAIMTREELGTTALGNGIAFPHSRTELVDGYLGVLGLEPRGIRFDALDRSLVFGVFLLVAPVDVRQEYFDILGRITAIGKDKSLRLQLRGCRTAEAAHQFLQVLDAE